MKTQQGRITAATVTTTSRGIAPPVRKTSPPETPISFYVMMGLMVVALLYFIVLAITLA